MKRWLLFIPAVVLILFAISLFLGLQQDPLQKTKDLIGKPLPTFQLADLAQPTQQLTQQNLPKNQVYLLNIWGSWCQYCRQEFPLLHEITQQYQIPIVGVDYLDLAENAQRTLRELGNPFIFNLYDSKGIFVTELGLNGAPYTFIIDQQGVVRYFFDGGAINQTVWQQQMLPLIKKLRGDTQ